MANNPKTGANDGLFKLKYILWHSQVGPFLHRNKPSRESIFCGKVGSWWAKKALIMLKNEPKIVQNKSASGFLLARFRAENRSMQKRVLVEKWLKLALSTEVKTPCVCKPLYEMGTVDALNSLTEVRCVLCRTHVYKKKSPSGMANHATGRYAWVTPYRRRISAERG